MTRLRRARAAGVFASRAFRQYFIGQSLSMLGDGLRLLAIPLLAYHLTHSALSTGAAFICETVPFSLFALIGGSLADRIDRRRLMIGCDAIRFLVLTFFAVAYWYHVLSLGMIYGGLVVISICAAAFMGGQSSSIPYLLGRKRSTEAVAVLMTAENLSYFVTPVLGGAIFAAFGPLPALVLNAATYLGSQLSLMRIRSLGPDEPKGMPTAEHLVNDIKLGFRQLWHDTGMRAQAICGFFFNTFGYGCYAILIPFLKTNFGASDKVVGAFFGMSAAGAVVGAWFASRWAGRWPFGRALTTAYLIDAATFFPVVLVRNVWIVGACWMISNAVANFEIAQIIGFRLRVTPEEMVGRVMGAVRLFVLSGMAPGILVLGWIADKHGPLSAMWIACLGYVAIALVALVTPAIRNETR
jgi:MFS family permease